MAHNKVGGNMIYRISKSALNSAVKSISYDLSKTNMIIVALHPGWVRINQEVYQQIYPLNIQQKNL